MSTTVPTRAMTERRERISRKLLPVMEQMLEDEAFTEISVERLVREGDVSRSSFYMYFADKGDLLRELAEDVLTDLFGVARAWWELPSSASRDQLRDALESVFDAYEPHRKLLGAVIEAASYDREVAMQFEMLMTRAKDMVAGHIVRGQADGAVRAEIDPDRTAAWLAWMLERGLYELLDDVTPGDRAKRLDAITDIIWRTLYAGAR